MRCKLIRNWTAGVALALLSTVAPQAAKAYQVDCAILLCLAGGWPASAECAHARAVFCYKRVETQEKITYILHLCQTLIVLLILVLHLGE